MKNIKLVLINLLENCYYEIFSDFFENKVSIGEIKNNLLEILSEDKAKQFIQYYKTVKNDVIEDLHFTYSSDPACNSLEEIVMCYPGIYATAIYRLAHILFKIDERVLARICTEYAHSKTGIDIHPGAEIDSPFFIDHGTGIVIGETTIIGKKVKIYQGVTLGALNLENIEEIRNKKRHPTIENNVTIYAHATVLGGETIVGENTIIASNAVVLKSTEKNSKIISKCKH